MADERLAIAINTRLNAITQYTNCPFNSLCVFNGKIIGASEDGLFELDTGGDDVGDPIIAQVKTPISDLGAPQPKRMRKSVWGYETSGGLETTVYVDDQEAHTYAIPPNQTGQRQGRKVLPMGRGYGKGTYWQFEIGNVAGCDFSLDFLGVVPIVLNLNHG